MKISTKFLGSWAIVLVVIFSLMIGSDILLKKAETSAEVSRKKTEKAINIILVLQVSLGEQVIALKDYIMLNHNASDISRYRKTLSTFLTSLDELERVTPQAKEVKDIRRRHMFLNNLANQLRNAPSNPAQFQQDFRTLNSFHKDVNFYLSTLADRLQKQETLIDQETENFKQTTHKVKHLTMLVIILIFAGQFVLIIQPVIFSIQKLKFGAAKIGAGDWNSRLDIQTGDEIEQLAHTFNQMAARLAQSYYLLEKKVIERTAELTTANQNLETEISERKQAQAELQRVLHNLQQTQTQLIQTEKMSSLGQMVAGVAHEINNPVNFIYGNLTHASKYISDLLELVRLYQEHYPNPAAEIQDHSKAIELDFLISDLPKMLSSMNTGSERIRQIVLNLRNFSRLDEADMKPVDIHQGIDSTLLILQNRLQGKPSRPNIEVIKEYGDLPTVACYAGQMNQVFMNILVNAIDAIDSYYQESSALAIQHNSNTITIRTELLNCDYIAIRIADNGPGMTEEIQKRLFDPFFTTKPVGSGTGLGLSISYQIIVQKHGGLLKCISAPGEGTEFCIEIPVRPKSNSSSAMNNYFDVAKASID